MAKEQLSSEYIQPLKRVLFGLTIFMCVALFLAWRLDSPRAERFRFAVMDRILPPIEAISSPFSSLFNIIDDFQSYQRLSQQNADLRRELQKMKAWREAAFQLDQKNATLLALNNVRLDPALTYITGVVTADSGSPFRQSVLLNIGARDGVKDGWPAMDGIGLVGRISGVGKSISRVLLLSDTSSRIPVAIQASGQTAILAGDNSLSPVLEFIENADLVRPGDRVVTTGDGGAFPADLLVGQVVLGTDGRLRARLAADYQRLAFLRVLRVAPLETLNDTGDILPIRNVNLTQQPTQTRDKNE